MGISFLIRDWADKAKEETPLSHSRGEGEEGAHLCLSLMSHPLGISNDFGDLQNVARAVKVNHLSYSS